MTLTDFSEPLEQVDRVFVRHAGRKLLYFGGCDYYRLSSDIKILTALQTALHKYGLSTAASRKTTGNHRLYEKLEQDLAKFFGAPRAVLLSSGYLANIAFAQALRGRCERILLDERSHDSLREAARIVGCPVIEFAHRDPKDIERRLRGAGSGTQRVVATDGVFAFNGSLAPLKAYRAAAGPRVLFWVDDAHAAGVLGAKGRGSIEQAGIAQRNVVQTVTFSKAFGVYGGAVLCSEAWRDALVAQSSAVSGNTPLPLPLAAATQTALGLITPPLRAKLFENVKLFWRSLGRIAPRELNPIMAFVGPKSLSRQLLAAGIYPSLIKYPGGPADGFFRFALSSEHTAAQVGLLADTLRAADPVLAT
jgi:8-amino-7-oxononanoate synthase